MKFDTIEIKHLEFIKEFMRSDKKVFNHMYIQYCITNLNYLIFKQIKNNLLFDQNSIYIYFLFFNCLNKSLFQNY